VHWPEEYKWKIITNQEDDTVHFIELIPGKEEPDKWTMLGMMGSFKNTIVPSADIIIKIYEEASLKESPLAKLTVLEKSKEGDGIWVLFKVETPSFPNDPKPESQLWYVIQGEKTLHSMFIAKKVLMSIRINLHKVKYIRNNVVSNLCKMNLMHCDL